jgi:hypothetical protein
MNGLTASFEDISPRQAELYLKKNTHNRPLQEHHVKFLASEMLNDRWKFNGDTIVFCNNDILRQGQHRLSAIIKTGCTQKFIVVRGIEPDAFSTMDCGKTRNGSDALALIGEKNTKAKSAILVWIDKYYNGSIFNLNRSGVNKKISPSYILELNAIYSDLELLNKDARNLGCMAIINASQYIFSKLSKSDCEHFFHKILTGENILNTDPEMLLRNRLIQNQISKAKLSNKYIFALFIKTWNARRSGIPLKSLRYKEEGNSETFPTAI